jgi:hypothetical protein
MEPDPSLEFVNQLLSGAVTGTIQDDDPMSLYQRLQEQHIQLPNQLNVSESTTHTSTNISNQDSSICAMDQLNKFFLSFGCRPPMAVVTTRI